MLEGPYYPFLGSKMHRDEVDFSCIDYRRTYLHKSNNLAHSSNEKKNITFLFTVKNDQILYRSCLFMYRTLDKRTKVLSAKIRKLCFFSSLG